MKFKTGWLWWSASRVRRSRSTCNRCRNRLTSLGYRLRSCLRAWLMNCRWRSTSWSSNLTCPISRTFKKVSKLLLKKFMMLLHTAIINCGLLLRSKRLRCSGLRLIWGNQSTFSWVLDRILVRSHFLGGLRVKEPQEPNVQKTYSVKFRGQGCKKWQKALIHSTVDQLTANRSVSPPNWNAPTRTTAPSTSSWSLSLEPRKRLNR